MEQMHALTYCSIPTTSRIIVRGDERGVVITIPSTSLASTCATIIFGVFMMIVVSFVMIGWILDTTQDLTGIYILKPIALCLTLLVFWTVLFLIIHKLVQDGRAPNRLTVQEGKLVIKLPSYPSPVQAFDLDGHIMIFARKIGLGLNLRECGELQVKRDGNVLLAFLNGRNWRELEWIAGTLNEAIKAVSVAS
jgi:hypothetical protein